MIRFGAGSPGEEDTYWVKVARAEGAAILQDLVQTLLHRRQLVGLQITNVSRVRKESGNTVLTIGISSSDTGSLDESSR